MEGVYVLAQGRRQVHRLDEAQIRAARVAEQVAEQIDTPTAVAREVEVVDAMVHLGLGTWPGLKARHGRRRGTRPQSLDALAHDGVLAAKSTGLQFLEGALAGQVQIAGEQLLQDRLV